MTTQKRKAPKGGTRIGGLTTSQHDVCVELVSRSTMVYCSEDAEAILESLRHCINIGVTPIVILRWLNLLPRAAESKGLLRSPEQIKMRFEEEPTHAWIPKNQWDRRRLLGDTEEEAV